jgi:hypothetical protein
VDLCQRLTRRRKMVTRGSACPELSATQGPEEEEVGSLARASRNSLLTSDQGWSETEQFGRKAGRMQPRRPPSVELHTLFSMARPRRRGTTSTCPTLVLPMSVTQARVRNLGHLCVADEFWPYYMIAALPFGGGNGARPDIVRGGRVRR